MSYYRTAYEEELELQMALELSRRLALEEEEQRRRETEESKSIPAVVSSPPKSSLTWAIHQQREQGEEPAHPPRMSWAARIAAAGGGSPTPAAAPTPTPPAAVAAPAEEEEAGGSSLRASNGWPNVREMLTGTPSSLGSRLGTSLPLSMTPGMLLATPLLQLDVDEKGKGPATQAQQEAEEVEEQEEEEEEEEEAFNIGDEEEEEEGGDFVCAICLAGIELSEMATIKGCEHHYCAPCIVKWSCHRPLCPQCKKPFTHLYTYRSLDGTLHDFQSEESLVLLQRAKWLEDRRVVARVCTRVCGFCRDWLVLTRGVSLPFPRLPSPSGVPCCPRPAAAVSPPTWPALGRTSARRTTRAPPRTCSTRKAGTSPTMRRTRRWAAAWGPPPPLPPPPPPIVRVLSSATGATAAGGSSAAAGRSPGPSSSPCRPRGPAARRGPRRRRRQGSPARPPPQPWTCPWWAARCGARCPARVQGRALGLVALTRCPSPPQPPLCK